jgi:FixJ family two-component response regulator
MPEMSGPELASRVRSSAPTLRVLFMSGYAGIPPSDALNRVGEFSVLEKPFRPKELVEKVRALISGS